MIQWVSEHRVPGTLGVTDAEITQVKTLLSKWAQGEGSQSASFQNYGTKPEDYKPPFDKVRDGATLESFSVWWNSGGKPPHLPPGGTSEGIVYALPDAEHLLALQNWAASNGISPAPPPEVVVPPIIPANPLPLPEVIAKGVCESAGHVWDPVNKVCHGPCPTGQVWDFSAAACVQSYAPPVSPSPTAPPGQTTTPPAPAPGSPGSNFNPPVPPASKPSSNASLIVGVLGVIGLIGIVLSATRGGGNPFKAEVPKRTLGENPYASREHLRRMTKADAKRMFEQYVLPGIEEQYGPTDAAAIRTAWNDFVDSLQKDGRITEKQAATWLSPYDR